MVATVKCDTITEASNTGTANISLDSSGNVTIGNNLTVNGTTTQTGNVSFTGSAAVGGNATIGGATFSPSAPASGSLALTGTVAMGSSFKRNRLINGNMAVDQRGTASSAVTLTTSQQYTVDRWGCATNTSSSSTVTAQRVSTGLSPFPYALRVLRGSGTWTGAVSAAQVIETINCQDLAGQTVTVSIWIRAGSAFTGTFYVQGLSGSGTDQGLTSGASGTWTNWAGPVIKTSTAATTTLTQYTFPWSVPAGTNEVGLYIVALWSGGTGSANDYVDITGVQLEVGSVATPYERQIYSDQLSQCQRYYYLLTRGNSSDVVYGTGMGYSSTQAEFTANFPVTMRTAPNIVTSSVANSFTAQNGTISTTCTTYNIFGATTQTALVYGTTFTGLTNGVAYRMSLQAQPSTVFIAFNAEL